MLLFEIKKVFLKPANKIALVLLAGVLAAACYCAVVSVEYVDEEGETAAGAEAARLLRSKKMEWAGFLTEDVLAEVIRQNAFINASEEYLAQDVRENNKAYAKKQGFSDIRDMINRAFCGFKEYNYYRADSISENEVSSFYANRVFRLKEWLYSEEAQYRYSEEEKQFLIGQYERLEEPLYYEYADGWGALLEFAPSVIMIMVLLLGFPISGIFSNEFQWKSDAVFFSSKHGRDKAVASKVSAGFCIVTGIYWIAVAVYSAVVLGILGTEGAGCAVQMSHWKSFYNINFLEAYLLTIGGGYIGSLFMLTLSMLVSAKTHSPVLSAAIPFLLIFLPSFADSFSVFSDMLGLFPDQLLQMGRALDYFNLYRIGGKIVGAVPVLLGVYGAGYFLMPPILYRMYRKSEVR